MMKSLFSLALAVVIGTQALMAQSVEDGRKFYYYERYKSAKETFEKVIAANPNDINSTYWLGQTLIEQKNVEGARSVYQQALSKNGNAPMLLVGMGHVELLGGKKDEAKQRFETAISLTKGKDVEVLKAIALASVDAKDGDANYVLEKLTPVTQQKGFKDPEVWLLIGDAYRKLVDGGNAVLAYQRALVVDPKLAAAKHRIGRVYLTQKNPDSFLPPFEDAIKMDPKYAPAFYDLYVYWYNRDINKAKQYFDQYLAVADQTPSNDYDKASIIYASRDFTGAINVSKDFITKLGDNADPRFYKLIAYSYDELKDSVNAKNYLEQYFAKQKPENFVPKDYEFRAITLAKFPGNEVEAMSNYDKAIAMDTAQDSRLELMTNAAALAKKTGDRSAEAKYLGDLYKTKKNPKNVDLYNWGFARYQATDYQGADSVFAQYTAKYPNEIFGYLWQARSNQAMDTSMTKGLAVPHYEKLAEMARSIDSVKYKSQAITSYFYLVSYYNDIKKDKVMALRYIDKVLEVDPGNADALRIREILNKAPKGKTASK